MNKKLIIGIGAGVAAAALTLGLGLGLGLKHKHAFSDEWVKDENSHWHEAACGHTDEVSEKAAHTIENEICTVCGYNAHVHTYSAGWSTDETEHWRTATCAHTDEVSEKGVHTFTDGKCSVCGFTPVVYTVSDAEWEAAFALFCDEPYGEGKAPPLSFTCTGKAGNEVMTLQVDCTNKALYFEVKGSDGVTSLSEYYWEDEQGRILCTVGESNEVYDESDDIGSIYLLFEDFFETYAGTMFMNASFVGKYEDFTYDAENGKYAASDGRKAVFANGKLQEMSAIDTDWNTEYTFTYVYSASVTIPDLTR